MYDRLQGALAVLFSTCCWFFITNGVHGEQTVLWFVPKIIRKTLSSEAERARIRLRDHDGKSNKTKFEESTLAMQIQKDKQFLLQLQNRSAGIFNSVVSVFLAIFCTTLDPKLRNDKIFGISYSWLIAGSLINTFDCYFSYLLLSISGAFISGYFLWDLIVILLNYNSSPDNWQWLLHALICFSALVSPFFAEVAPMSYYASLFLVLEASSPFLGVRWYCLKTMQLLEFQHTDCATEHKDCATEIAYVKKISSLASATFAVVFFLVRIVFAPIALFIPLMRVFLLHPISQEFNSARWWMYVCSIPAFFILNVFWMVKIIEASVSRRKHKNH